jgi:pimeloyl-ACP methyl ester carboxylesterase
MSTSTFKISVPQARLDDLHARLEQTRWPDAPDGTGWELGADLDYMQALTSHWRSEYDWRAAEAKLNALPHFRAEIDGFGIHFVHARGRGPYPIPIVVTHGWPGSFYEMAKLIPLLTDPTAHGGNPADAFDVIVPALPGFAFSDRPRTPGMSLARTAGLWTKLMREELGYRRFAAAGSDFGAILTQHLAESHADALIGIHLTYIGYFQGPPEAAQLSDAERAYLKHMQQWVMQEGGYAIVQSTRPQSLAFGLMDSPVGLAAWLTEKYRAWTDCDGDIERRMTKDELLTHIMIYWLSDTIASSIRTYAENPPPRAPERIAVPAAFASFPKDISPPPREWVARRLNLQQFTEMPRGGHFAAWEEPELLAADIRAFFRQYRRAHE